MSSDAAQPPAPNAQDTDLRQKSKDMKALRGLVPFMFPYFGLLIAASVALVATASVSLVLPIAVRRVIDNFNSSVDGLLDQYFSAAIGLAALLALGTALRYYLVTILGERVVTDIRKAVFDRVIGLSPNFYERVQTGEVLDGHVEVDGAFFGGHIRPANEKADRKDRRLKRHQTGKRRVVIAMRERYGRVLPFVRKSEADGVALVAENVSRMATLSADEASHWDMLHAGWDVDRVNHSECYSDHGKHTNLVESYFARLRRMVEGQHHGVSPQYLHQYVNQAAWLEDNRRTDNGTQARIVVSNAMGSPIQYAANSPSIGATQANQIGRAHV